MFKALSKSISHSSRLRCFNISGNCLKAIFGSSLRVVVEGVKPIALANPLTAPPARPASEDMIVAAVEL